MIHMLLDFINFMRDNLEQSNDNDSAILKWLELVIELSDDSEVNLNHELSDTMEALKYVKNNFRPKVFQYSLRFPTLSNEIINGALCFNAGYPKDMVEQFAEKGLIKCGYMPKHEDETGSFIVVKISEPENGMVVFDNVSEKTVLHSIRRASTEAIDKDGEISAYIQKGIVCHRENVARIGSEPLKAAFEKALENTSAVKKMFTVNPVNGEVESFDNKCSTDGEINTGIEDDCDFGIRLM